MKNEIMSLVARKDYKQAAQVIRSGLDADADFEGAHVLAAHAVLQAADWDGVTRLLPKGTNFFASSGMLNSIQKGRPVNAEDEPIPWFTYPAIDFLDSVVQPEWSVFEYGSGNSTMWWAKRVRQIISVEDDAAWYAEVIQQTPANSELQLRVGEAIYADAIKAYPDASFDVIVIDGSHRNACALAASSKVSPNGVIIFDNADGPEFDAGQQHLLDCGFYRLDFWGPIPSYLYKNCTSVFFRNPDLLRRKTVPSQHRSSIGRSCFQMLGRA
jgi:hypothetical protein